MKIIAIIFKLFLSAAAFVISYKSFQEKGYLFNNAYIWASKEERKAMDKKPYYRQSGIVFLLLGIIFLLLGIEDISDIRWMSKIEVTLTVITVIYAVVSSVKIEISKRL